jgi:hypothetical protein
MAETSAEPLSRKGRNKLKKATKTEETAAKKKLRAQVDAILDELFDEIDALLTIHPRGAGWPDERRILLQLVADHYDARDLPPLAPRVAGGRAGFVQVGQQQTELLDLIAWRRREP